MLLSCCRALQEPELLLEERQQVERSMQSSALSHYHAFIDSANCLSVVQQQLGSACEGLGSLSQSVPELAGAFEAFSKDAATVMAQHNANKQLLGESVHRTRGLCAAVCAAAGAECMAVLGSTGPAAIIKPLVHTVMALHMDVAVVWLQQSKLRHGESLHALAQAEQQQYAQDLRSLYVNFKVVIAKHLFLLVLTEDAHRCVFK